MTTSNVTIRMDDALKSQADKVFGEMGMSFTTAVNVFTRQVVRERRIPFEISARPNEESINEAAVKAAVDFSKRFPEDFARMTK